ncbi:hypothetical protein BDQ94DRAFT_134708 [Aspergillus welwitschiae]|uniref:Uncharacterized protein n=1 Tax=Aspergillus welwitschiae TaxID=1341132 RepID=A0A3F3QI11_9EURO|nr:hypothetical protein BDQ94DRAFT_134708 [Aspergillus welwitschiae]RDH38821.1 hypothetical protein BDQ94DRAFT_134708 [Aspergillus welwitschiae]
MRRSKDRCIRLFSLKRNYTIMACEVTSLIVATDQTKTGVYSRCTLPAFQDVKGGSGSI